jgi:molybdate transport system substrate-binding protein
VRQVEAGAPVDVFASAGEKEMNELQSRGLIDEDSRRDFARNTLVLVVPNESKLDLHSFDGLANPAVNRIAIGNPNTVPAGRYARQLLETPGLWHRLESRLIPGESVRQVLDYVDRGEVSAGIVYATDIAVAHGRVRVVSQAPEGKYGPVLYPIAVLKSSSHQQAAGAFVT